MKFLDLNGLTHFWDKIKDWSNSNFFSKRGGEIHPTSGLQYIISGEQLDVSKSGNENSTISVFNVNENGISAERIVKTGGTATQVLMADGSVKTLNANNGIAGLDSNGNVPLAQLGNLDTTVAEVVTALPTTNIKKHIYLIKDASNVTQNKYEEYIYTGDTSAEYDSSKWEKLGDFRATVDLAGYAKKSEMINDLAFDQKGSSLFLAVTKGDNTHISVFVPTASSSLSGAMSNTDKSKLDGIEANANNYSLPLATASLRGGIQVGYAANGKNYPVQLSGEKAYVNVPWTDTTYDLTPYAKKNEAVGLNGIQLEKTAQGGTTKQNITFSNINKGDATSVTFEDATTNMSGFMSVADKNKLNKFNMSNISDNIDVSLLVTAEFNDVEINGNGNYLAVSLATLGGNDRLTISLPLATSNANGIMSASNKVKLDGIASGATADSAITTAEIDALFA